MGLSTGQCIHSVKVEGGEQNLLGVAFVWLVIRRNQVEIDIFKNNQDNISVD